MIRLRLFGRCRIYHDPVSPVLNAPAQIGWAARFRSIDLVTPRKLKGRELLMRTRGWWTVEPSEVLETVEEHGKLVLGDQGELNRYLLRAYRIYINKMLDIGLGGATMTFGKFAFLFGDLHDKGVDFRERFETMYGFLKKDKRGIGVSESVPANVQLSIADCAPLEEHMIACVGQGRNYIYLRSDS